MLNPLSFAMALKLTFLAIMMFAFGYAMVPLYEKICEATGLNNLLQPATDTDRFTVVENRQVRTEFVTNARGQVAMTPSHELARLRPGETYSVIYTLTNLSDQPLFGQAVPAYSPARSERWFKKIQCFCFDQLRMEAGETRKAPVVFVISPDLPPDIETISLSYTFFEIEGAS